MPSPSEFKSASHNHVSCIASAMHKAEHLCTEHNLRFTPIRRRVLELVWASHAPIVAYDILKILRKDRKNAEAPTVYRALDFLLQHRLVHKIESLNAFVGCTHPDKPHVSQFLICTQCCQAVELMGNHVRKSIEQQALEHDFVITEQTIEISGFCPQCRS